MSDEDTRRDPASGAGMPPPEAVSFLAKAWMAVIGILLLAGLAIVFLLGT